MTVKELQDLLSYYPEDVEVFCDGYLITGILRGLDTDGNVEYVELIQEAL